MLVYGVIFVLILLCILEFVVIVMLYDRLLQEDLIL